MEQLSRRAEELVYSYDLFIEALAECVHVNGFDAATVADRLEVSLSSVADLLAGISNPTFYQVRVVMLTAGVTPEQLLNCYLSKIRT